MVRLDTMAGYFRVVVAKFTKVTSSPKVASCHVAKVTVHHHTSLLLSGWQGRRGPSIVGLLAQAVAQAGVGLGVPQLQQGAQAMPGALLK